MYQLGTSDSYINVVICNGPTCPTQPDKCLTKNTFQRKEKISFTFPKERQFSKKKLFRVCQKEPITQPTRNFLQVPVKPTSYNY